jgi:RNA methyltransferase, TrmH family
MLVKSKLKYIQTLGQKKFRQEERIFIAEGPKIVAELLQARKQAVTEIYAVKEWIEENTELLKQVNCTEITEQELERISQLSTPNKVIALVQQFEEPAGIVTKDRVTLVLDAVQDPGNLGTIIRIADWFGITQIVCSEDSADVYNPKVVQATMGSIARVNVAYMDLEEWLGAQEDISIYAAMLGGMDITEMKRINEGIIVIGNESKGISQGLLKMADTKITIPKKGNAESLNAAIATGIILSHLTG